MGNSTELFASFKEPQSLVNDSDFAAFMKKQYQNRALICIEVHKVYKSIKKKILYMYVNCQSDLSEVQWQNLEDTH